MARINEWAVDWLIGRIGRLSACLPDCLSVQNTMIECMYGLVYHDMPCYGIGRITSIRLDWTGLDSRALPIQSEALCHHHHHRRLRCGCRCRLHSHHRWWVSNYASNILLLFLVLSCCFCNDNYNCFAILYLPLFPLI